MENGYLRMMFLLLVCFFVLLEITTDVVGEGGTAKDIPKPDRYQETVDTFTTVASNLSELAQVCPIADLEL